MANFPAHEARVFRVTLDRDDAAVASLRGCLSADELAHAAGLVVADRARKFIVRRAMLRSLLGKLLDRDPERIRFRCNRQGKPEIDEPTPSLHFNVSHAGNHAIFAVSRDRPIGIDLEIATRTLDIDLLAKRSFSTWEYEQFVRMPLEARRYAFLRIWTCKESVMKALGLGFSLSIDTVEIDARSTDEPVLRSIGGAPSRAHGWNLRRLEVWEDCVATLACDGPLVVVKIEDMD
jgi:4'-phosphopantetheinyl transferase